MCIRDSVSVDRGGGNRGGLVVNDDAQLAIQLHRAMNSSPRISRNSCLLNAIRVNVAMVNGHANSEALQALAAEKMCFPEAVNVRSNDDTVDIDSFSRREQNRLSSVETRKDFVQNIEEKGQMNKPASDLNDCLITYSRKRQVSQDGRAKEPDGLLRMYRRRLSHVERRNAERNHCFRTYHRRLSTMSHCKNDLVNGGFNLEHGILASALTLNCCKKTRVFDDAS